jgi:DEAD/DEAH box helicase domain-containing protein
MLACFDCRNLEHFQQVSVRLDRRDVTQTTRGLVTGPWDRADPRPPGLYCSTCGESVAGAVDDLADTRVDFVPPADFRAETLAKELLSLRPDATWSRVNLAGRAARTAELNRPVAPPLLAALARTGRLPLYTHQAQAIDAAVGGAHVVQATAAGSGKSLGFLVPVLDRLVTKPAATAILVFPLRALANDQLNGLVRLGVQDDPWVSETSFDLDLGGGAKPIRVSRYDGATPDYDKKAIRTSTRLLITTPDMLHASILRMAARKYQDGTGWTRLLRGLAFVVLDEIHSYQGVFGSNVAQVVRRLRRAAVWHGGDPRFLAASATVGNPRELAERLTGAGPFELVDDDGSPQRPRTVLICNPPIASEQTAKKRRATLASEPSGEAVVEPDDGERRLAPQTVALEIIAAGALASEGHPPVRSICFARSRGEVFALTKRIQARLESVHRADLGAMVTAYAATLLADDRVAAEGSLRDGSMLAVVSTNALELGIDIPDLSLAVLCGYPGQVSSFRQRAGRVGRAGEGLVVLIVGDDPLQQHLAQRPDALAGLLAGRAEDVVISPDAPEVARRYGLQAGQADLGGVAFEDAEYFGKDAVAAWLDAATGRPDVVHNDVAYWRGGNPDEEYDYPGLRNAAGERSYTVWAVTRGNRRPIGVIDAGSAPRDAFVPAVWPGPNGALYRISGFDTKLREIYCEGPTNLGYLTRGVPVDTVEVGEALETPRALGHSTVGYSHLGITRNVYSYKQLHFSGVEQTLQVERRWAPMAFATEGLHLHLDPAWLDGPWEKAEAIRGLEHVLLALAPVVVACDPHDIEATSDGQCIYLYDSFGGGIGITRPAFERLAEIARLGAEVVADCPCERGCPGCVHLSRRPEGNRGLSKAGALHLLRRLADEAGPRAT